jgi:hypothetical protein
VDEIVRLYKANELAAELGRFHAAEDGNKELFLQRCIALHNSGDIDLIDLTGQPAFAGLNLHAFFTAQHLYCEAIPQLRTNATALMECCKILVEKGSNDLAAGLPYGAFRKWCQNNPSDGARVIQNARTDDPLAKRFVMFALQAANDVEGAIEFIKTYVDDRRLSGMNALGSMVFTDTASAKKAVEILEPYVADSSNDHLRVNALVAAFGVLKQYKDATAELRLIESAASEEPGPETLHGLARIVWQHRTTLDSNTLRIASSALVAVSPKHLGTVREIDMALHQLLGTKDETLVLDFLTAKLQDSELKIGNFESVAHELAHSGGQRLYELIVRWFLSGNFSLCNNVSDIVGIDKERAFDTTAQPLGLTSAQQIFLCRKAIGFLFVRPVICCSIIVSVLRAGNQDVEGVAADLLFDPILLNYGGDAKDYLDSIPSTDASYGAIKRALTQREAFYAGLEAAGTIKELHPSEYQRDVVRQRAHDDMRTIRKAAEDQSIFLNLVHRSTILYGKRSLNYVQDADGEQRAVAMDLKSVGMSIELPRREVLDPVGLDYMLRVFRAERLK